MSVETNSSMEGEKRDIFSKTKEENPLFLPKMKIKRNTGCPNKE